MYTPFRTIPTVGPVSSLPPRSPPVAPARTLPVWFPVWLVPCLLAPAGCQSDRLPQGEPPAAGPAEARVVVETNGAPEAIGPYSQAIQAGNTLYLAGQLGLDPATGELVEGGIEAETRRALQNLGAVLGEAGFDFDDVVQSQVFLADLDEFGAMNEVYASFFGDRPPARATVEVARLPRDARVEIQLIAVRGDGAGP